MKKIEKWAQEHIWFLIILLVCLIISIWIYQYMYEKRIEQSGVASPGGEIAVMMLPILYLGFTWKEWAN